MLGIKEVINRNSVLITAKLPFSTWIMKDSCEEYRKNDVLNYSKLFSVPVYVNKENYENEFIREFKKNIFFTMLNDYEASCTEEEFESIFNEKVFKDYFDYTFISDCIDVSDIRLLHGKIRTRGLRLRKFITDEESE